MEVTGGHGRCGASWGGASGGGGSAPESVFVQVSGTLRMQGVPDLPGAPQDEAGLMRKFET